VALLALSYYGPAEPGVEWLDAKNSRCRQLAIVCTSRKARAVGGKE
jgi:hypothetical protein